MRILQVSNFFKPSWETGGVTKVNYELSKQLVSRGHEVTVYTTDGYNSRLDVKKNKSVDVDGIKVYYFYNISRLLVKKMKFPTPYYLPFVIRKEIKSFDIIHIHEHRTLSAAIVHYYAKKNRVPYILQSHGSVLPFMQKQIFKKLFDVLFGYSILKNATKVIALNEDEAFQYQDMGIDINKIVIIPNGVNLNDFKVPSKNNIFKNKYSLKPEERILLYIGRIHNNKGLDLLIDSFSLLLKKYPNVKLVFVGPDNGYQHQLEEKIINLNIQSSVLFTGFLDNDLKTSALYESDIFVTPAFSGFPVTFLEASVFGLPIITTKKGDNLNWIHEKVGYVVEYDQKELCDAIYNLLIDEDTWKKFSTNGKKLVEHTFSMDAFIGKIIDLYKHILSQKSQRST